MDSGGKGEFVVAGAEDCPKGSRVTREVGRGGAQEVEEGRVWEDVREENPQCA